ncbi:Gfo/Idh/MocA family oxidoreductase [bacterium]|nr:Gfo/Idh/MocA family oxidoreductase [bacterium]
MAKRIGFYDNKLENWHANTYLEILRDKLPDCGYEISVCKALDEADGREWAKKNNVPYAGSIEEFADKCDYVMILAPSDPELHLQMAETILPLGKTTFIDKTFAPDLATARKIFALADKHNVAVITTSALRFTDEFNAVVKEIGKSGIKHMSMWGGGRSFGEYSIHPVEGIISTMGADVTHVMRWGDEQFSQVNMKFKGGRTATAYVYVNIACPYMAVITDAKEVKFHNVDSPIFDTQTKHILDFFAKGKPTIPREESLAVREILDIASDPKNHGKWVATSLA